MRTEVYMTGVSERGKRFKREKQWKGQRPVSESEVQYMRDIAAASMDEGERARAEDWLADYEESSK